MTRSADFDPDAVAHVIAQCKALFHEHPITIHEAIVVATQLLTQAIDLLDPDAKPSVARKVRDSLLKRFPSH